MIAETRRNYNIPVAAYSVSGEYALVKAASQLGYVNEKDITLEILHSIKRAGADMIVTYFAKISVKIPSRTMRNDERFEIQRAFDLLPHVVGASWTVVWF